MEKQTPKRWRGLGSDLIAWQHEPITHSKGPGTVGRSPWSRDIFILLSPPWFQRWKSCKEAEPNGSHHMEHPPPMRPTRERSCTWRGLHRVNWCFELHSTQMPLCCRDVAFTWMQKGASKHDLELMENDVLKEIFNCFGSVEPCAIDWKQPYKYTLLKETPVAHGDVPPSSHHPCYSISKDKLCLGTLGLSSSRFCCPYGPFLVPHLLA